MTICQEYKRGMFTLNMMSSYYVYSRDLLSAGYSFGNYVILNGTWCSTLELSMILMLKVALRNRLSFYRLNIASCMS